MKIQRKENFRIEVTPRSLGDYGFLRTSDDAFGRTQEDIEKEYKQRCEQIKEDIQRHVDNISYVDVQYDSYYVCSHCGYGWEIDPENGEPLCCQKALDEFNQSK